EKIWYKFARNLLNLPKTLQKYVRQKSQSKGISVEFVCIPSARYYQSPSFIDSIRQRNQLGFFRGIV
ncbi:hypothetical protein, partial [Fischerella thermalis]|uniref:hypothetical protein n=1 Tax=Fischerella thermalis TaxID=372787 RepID=UPI001CA59A38